MFSDDIVSATIRSPGTVIPVQDFPLVEASRSDRSASGLTPSGLPSSGLAPSCLPSSGYPLRFSLQLSTT